MSDEIIIEHEDREGGHGQAGLAGEGGQADLAGEGGQAGLAGQAGQVIQAGLEVIVDDNGSTAATNG